MIKKPIVAGNWKMNKTPQEGLSFVGEIANLLLDVEKSEVIFCPPFPALFHMNEIMQDTAISLGAQNCHWEVQGAYTGEVSTEMLLASGVSYVIIGHSERRHIFNEPDEWINKKVQAVLNAKMTPILCIGETLQEREDRQMKNVLNTQLANGLRGIDSLEKIVIAYEPVWAIGTGVNALPNQVMEAHDLVRKALSNKYPMEEVNEVPVLYGGSVTDRNAEELIKTKGVDGFLIGGASLKIDVFNLIAHCVESHYTRN